MKKVSAIITTHNRINLLKEAIASVESQTYPEIELVVVNDKSDDGTKEYLDSLNGDSIIIKHLYGDESKGGNHARNIGVNIASGELIAFLDDDDSWYKKKIEEQVNFFEENKDIGLVYCGYERVFDEKHRYFFYPNSKFRGQVGLTVFTGMFTLTSCIMIKRKLFYQVGEFDEKLSHWQDYDLLIRVAQTAKMDFINESLVKINSPKKEKNRLSNQVKKWKNAVEYLDIKHSDLIKQLNEVQKREKATLFYIDAADRYDAVGNKSMHKKYMKLAWKNTNSPIFFVRYFFNIGGSKLINIKCFLQSHNIRINKYKKSV